MRGDAVIVREVEDVPCAGLQFLGFRQGFHVGAAGRIVEFLTVERALEVVIDLHLVVAVRDAAVLQRGHFRVVGRAAGGAALAPPALAVLRLAGVGLEAVRLDADHGEVVVADGVEGAVLLCHVAHPDLVDTVSVEVHVLPLAERFPSVVFVRFLIEPLHRLEILGRRGLRGLVALLVGIAAAGDGQQCGGQTRRGDQ